MTPLDPAQLATALQTLGLMIAAVIVFIGPISKTLVDIARQSKPDSPGHVWPIMAFVFSAIIIGLAFVAITTSGVVQMVALTLLAAIFGIPVAVGITAAQNNANDAVAASKGDAVLVRNRRVRTIPVDKNTVVEDDES